jgi:hypothetical protein
MRITRFVLCCLSVAAIVATFLPEMTREPRVGGTFIGAVVADDGIEQPYYTASTFIVVSHDAAFFKHRFFSGYSGSVAMNRPEFRTWTDDYSNIIQILKK